MRYFISDLHIGDKSPWDQFGDQKAGLLIRLLERIDRDMNHSGELILLGDIFDFILLTDPETFLQKVDSANIFAGVKKAYPDLFKAFREFIRSGNTLFYVWGNHDYPMRFKIHGQEFQKAVLDRFWDSKYRCQIWVSDYYISRSHRLYAEHGHRYDPFNVHLGGNQAVLGTLLVSKFIRKWETWKSSGSLKSEGPEETLYPFRLLGHIRPRPNVIYYIDRLSDKGLLPENIKRELAKDLYRIEEEWNSSLPHIFFRVLETLPWFIQEGIVGSRLKDGAPKILRERASLLLKGYSTDLSVARGKATVGNLKDLNFAPSLVILGHTHFLEHNLENGRYVYANTGSWRDTAFVDREGRIVEMYNHCPYLEVIAPEHGEPPKIIFRKAADGEEINILELLKEYEEFGLRATLGYP
jgi:UDP-2,3-diacylglucosamine pyrophosphatase LpxH